VRLKRWLHGEMPCLEHFGGGLSAVFIYLYLSSLFSSSPYALSFSTVYR
jgi:hypothetical protein